MQIQGRHDTVTRRRAAILLLSCLLWMLNTQAMALGALSSGQFCKHAIAADSSSGGNLRQEPDAFSAHHAHHNVTPDTSIDCSCDVNCASCSDYFAGHSFAVPAPTKMATHLADAVGFTLILASYHDTANPPDTPPPR